MNKKVLVVDDNRQLQDELAEVFAENKIEIIIAETGSAAITVVEQDKIDVAVVDIRLPDFNGVDLIDRLRSIQPEIVFLLITGYASAESAIKALQKGVLDYIVKPFSPDELMLSVKKGLLVKDSRNISKNHLEELVKEKGILQAKVLMLEQINEIFMNRERKIIELKTEVNQLLKAARQQEKYRI